MTDTRRASAVLRARLIVGEYMRIWGSRWSIGSAVALMRDAIRRALLNAGGGPRPAKVSGDLHVALAVNGRA